MQGCKSDTLVICTRVRNWLSLLLHMLLLFYSTNMVTADAGQPERNISKHKGNLNAGLQVCYAGHMYTGQNLAVVAVSYAAVVLQHQHGYIRCWQVRKGHQQAKQRLWCSITSLYAGHQHMYQNVDFST